MPRIPLEPIPNVRLQAAPTLENFGGGRSAEKVTEAVGGLGTLAQNIAEKEMQDANDAWAKDAYSKLLNQKNELIYGEKGAMTRKGNDAQAAIGETKDSYEKAINDLESTASNDTQRSMLRHMATQEGVELNQALLHHASQERDQMKGDIFQALVSSSTSDAVLNHDVAPWKAGANIAKLTAAAQQEADRRGWTGDGSKDLREGLIKDVTSGVHSGIVDQMLKQNRFISAKKYFDEYKGDMNERDNLRLQGAVADGADRAWALNKADEVIAKSKDESDAIDKLQSISPERRKGVQEAVKTFYSTKRQADEERQKNTFENMSKSLESGITLADMKTQPEWYAISDSQRKALQNTVKMKSEGIEPNGDLFYGLKEQAVRDRREFSKRDLSELRGQMTDKELNELIDLQTGLEQGDTRQIINLDKFKTQNMIASDTLRQLGYNPDAKLEEKNGKKVSIFKRLLNEQVEIFKTENDGKAPTADETQKLAAGLAIKNVKVSDSRGDLFDSFIPAGTFADSKVAPFQLSQSDSINVESDDIPLSDKKAIARLLISRGLPVDDKNMKSYYLNKLRRIQEAK